jgi:uncharacterized protein (DUF1501 family)
MNPTTRRDFLRTAPLISLAPTVPGFIAKLARASTPVRDGRVLVVVQLDGGNDGLNTVIPFVDEAYAKNRPTLKLATDRLIKVSDGIGLHPAMGQAGKLLEAGQLGIVPGVGYPNPNRSHFASMAIWQTARLDEEEHAGHGWLGRGLDSAPGASSMFVGPGSIPVDQGAAGPGLEPGADRRPDARPCPRPAGGLGPGRRPGRLRPPEHPRRLRLERPPGRGRPG